MSHKRIYFIEFLRVFLILSVFLVHVGDWIDADLKKGVLEFLGTSGWDLAFATNIFFIIGGFFLYGRVAGEESINVFSHIGKLWMRLMPGIIFCYLLLLVLGARNWWTIPFCLFPSSAYGLYGDRFSGDGMAWELVGYSDWFVGVYFVTSCLFTALFATLRRGAAWLLICTLMLFCWCLQGCIIPGSMLRPGDMFFGFLTPELAHGICCMGLGMVAGYLSAHWKPRESIFLRLFATTIECLAIFMLFNFMYRRASVPYSWIAVHIISAALLISAAHGWGYISSYLNRFSGVMYASRYTYSLLLIQGGLVHYFRFNHNFGMDAHTSSLIILGAAVSLILVEYHFVEKWLVPKLVKSLRRGSDTGGGYT